MNSMSAHDALRFRRHHASWDVKEALTRDAQLYFVELFEPTTSFGNRWSIQRLGSRVVLSLRGKHRDVPEALFEEIVDTHRHAIVRCLEWRLDFVLSDLAGVRLQARALRRAIAEIRR